jgi:hypothetical protein
MPTRDQTATKNPNYQHGGYMRAEYRHWVYMKTRCAKDEHYLKYGITVCAAWVGDFAQFYADVGPKPFKRATLDRIDGTRGYEPGNVRWATYSEQNKNRIYRAGRAKPKTELAERLDVHINTLLYREKHGIAADAPKYGAHTQCRNGHEYTEKNTYVTKKGTRKCRACLAALRRKQREQLRGLSKTTPLV